MTERHTASQDESGKKEATEAVAERPIPSPCVCICALDQDDICVGCFRTGLEIAAWGGMTNEEKRQVLSRVAEREAASGRVI